METRRCHLDVTAGKEIHSGHLHAGGTSPDGHTIGCTNYYVTLDDKPFFVIGGEFEATRTPSRYWEEELRKIKAGGINMVTSYLYWIHHEEQRGRFDFAGDRDIRQFFELCGKVGLYAMARVGPFVHSECRNGGLPDWLYGMPFEVRSNDPGYLGFVKKWYRRLGEQLAGLFFQQGGPIIAVQLDNEHGSSGAPWDARIAYDRNDWVSKGTDSAAHVANLYDMATEAGLSAPLMMLTAWGKIPIVERKTIPLHGGYPFAAWDNEPKPSGYYLFRDGHSRPDDTIGYERPTDYPFANVEMQSGMQVRYNQRPVVPPRCPEALAIVRTGSGSNFLGYYVYHGGTNPMGAAGYLNEYLHPLRSYDYQAPLGEFGRARDSYKHLRTLHLFLQAFGQTLTPMTTALPAEAHSILPTDVLTPRYCARCRDGGGFVFLCNFQDHVETADIDGLVLDLHTNNGTLTVPREGSITLKKDTACILPFNMDLSGGLLRYATAQPLTVLHLTDYDHYFFFAPDGIDAEFCLDLSGVSDLAGSLEQIAREPSCVTFRVQAGLAGNFSFTSTAGRAVRVTTLTRAQAQDAAVGSVWGSQRLIVSPAQVIFLDDGLAVESVEQTDVPLAVFPPVSGKLSADGAQLEAADLAWGSQLRLHIPSRTVAIQVKDHGKGRYSLSFAPDLLEGLSDVQLEIRYTGDTAAAFIDGQLEVDDFHIGQAWTIGLKRYVPRLIEKGMTLYFRPLRKGTTRQVTTALAAEMKFEGQTLLEVQSIRAVPQYRAVIR